MRSHKLVVKLRTLEKEKNTPLQISFITASVDNEGRAKKGGEKIDESLTHGGICTYHCWWN